MQRGKAGGVLVCALTAAACGSSASSPPTIPAVVSVPLDVGDTLEIATDPLSLTIRAGNQVLLTAPAFVEIGLASPPDPLAYYDPAAPTSDVVFHAATRATAYDPATHTLTLALGDTDETATLALDPSGDAALTLATTATSAPDAVLARFVLPLAAGEELYGLGGLHDTPASRGVVREMQLRIDTAADASTNEVHEPIPFALSPTRGLAYLADELRPGAFDVGAARPDSLLVTFATPSLALRVHADTPLLLLDWLTARTGRPRVPPAWAFAPMQWRNETSGTTQLIDDAHTMRTLGVPGSTIWIDNPWQTAYNTFTFDSRVPDPATTIADLGKLGYHVIVWSTPYVDKAAPADVDHADAAAQGFLVEDDRGRPFDWPWQNGPGALVDFTAPGATAWWQQRIARVTALGVAGFKLDFGEDLVPELGGNKTQFRLHGGGTDLLHNAYAGVYQEAYLAALPDGDGFTIGRAAALGTQAHVTSIWPGDLDSDFGRFAPHGKSGGLPAAIAVGLSLSCSGFPFYGSDIGGFRGFPTTEALVRWAEYASVGTIMQLGGGGASHDPWDTTLFTAQALPIYQRYARLHMDLFPYLYSLAKRAGATGAPVTAPPGLIYPGHPYEDDFLVGDALFAAPVVEAGATTRTVTLPPGDWVPFGGGVLVHGGAPTTTAAPLDTLPLWQKVGAIVVMLATPIDTLLPATEPGVVSLADPAAARELRVLVAPGARASFTLWDGGLVTVGLPEGTPDHIGIAITPGTVHADFRVELDWTHGALGVAPPTQASVPMVADDVALEACGAPGCWRYDAPTGRALVRLVGGGLATIQ